METLPPILALHALQDQTFTSLQSYPEYLFFKHDYRHFKRQTNLVNS